MATTSPEALLREQVLADPNRSHARLRTLSSLLSEAELLSFLQAAPEREAALSRLETFAQQQPDVLAMLARDPQGLKHLAVVLSHSQVLCEDLLQHPGWLLDLIAEGTIYRPFQPEEFLDRLEALIPEGIPATLELATFRRRQMLRILLRDVLQLATLAEVTGELTALADALLEFSYRRIFADLMQRYGAPLDEAGQPVYGAILALGKLGGNELNYSSDIDLMYLYSHNGITRGGELSNKEFFKKLANQQTELLSAHTTEGICYRIDLRLRPDGRYGDVATSLDGAKSYYKSRARDWELQMLIKARTAAGSQELGREFLAFTDPLTYSTTLDFTAVEAVAESRERIHEKAAAKRAHNGSLNIKLAPGGIRDIEFLVQCLQRLHGGREQWVRHGGTMLALGRLRDKDLVSMQEYAQLASAYQFFRYLEHRLQIMQDRQTHSMPAAAAELESLARRMPADVMGGVPTAERLQERLKHHLAQVQNLYERVIHAQRPAYFQEVLKSETPMDAVPARPWSEPLSANMVRHLTEDAPRLARLVSDMPLRHGVEGFARFLESTEQIDDLLYRLDGDAVLARRLLDVFEHSTYFGDQIQRHPDLIEELVNLEAPHRVLDVMQRADACASPDELRVFFRKEQFRIQAAGLCLSRPVFETLERMSDLADAIIHATYQFAVNAVSVQTHLIPEGYHPLDQMMVCALGRLGMREFDLASDADLIFVLPDVDVKAQLFWTRVAEKMIELLTAYTSQGYLFTVDPRLRPNGNSSGLVQLESTYKHYFETAAEPWEGISYMKSRSITGNRERATLFLNELQEVDWRRCGQSMRSKASLRQMRSRIEKEHGATQRLKSGPGAFYDVDFILMYLRLKGAGLFFPVLNTPQRIDVVEKMGHLEREDADFLRFGATFYRAIDHALRFYSGHTSHTLPRSEVARNVLAEMVRRWVPDSRPDAPLEEQLAQTQRDTRALFDRIFQ